MKVSREWQTYAQQLRKMANNLRVRPTLDSTEHVQTLIQLATELEEEARIYAEEEEGPDLA